MKESYKCISLTLHELINYSLLLHLDYFSRRNFINSHMSHLLILKNIAFKIRNLGAGCISYSVMFFYITRYLFK